MAFPKIVEAPLCMTPGQGWENAFCPPAYHQGLADRLLGVIQSRCHSEENDLCGTTELQGKSAGEIRIALMAKPLMWSVKLSNDELELVAAYLEYLENASD